MVSAIEAASVSVKTMADGTLRITFDIEPTNAQAAFALFGAPGTPAALAALKVGHAAKSDEQAEEKPKGGALAKLAGMLCQDPAFVQFIRPEYDKIMGGDGSAWGDVSPKLDFGGSLEKYARHAILVICGVTSRAELDHNPTAAALFHDSIRKPYAEWHAASNRAVDRATA